MPLNPWQVLPIEPGLETIGITPRPPESRSRSFALDSLDEAEKELLAAYEVFRNEASTEKYRNLCVVSLADLYKKWHEFEPEQGYNDKSKHWRQ